MQIELTKTIDPATDHNLNLWMTGEVCRFYIEKRRRFCTFLELLDLFSTAPLCTYCAFSDPFPPNEPPDISPQNWKDDVSYCLGEDCLKMILNECKRNPDFGIRCKYCNKILQPWEKDDVYVISYHLVKLGQIEPSRKLKQQIKNLYGNRCFRCNKELELHIDHINPRCNGGNSDFRNLQPLCKCCGQLKSDRIPEEVCVLAASLHENR